MNRINKTFCMALHKILSESWTKSMKGKPMSTLTVSGAQMYYEVVGEGPLLILIPRASGTGESFRPLVPYLSAHYQVIIYDRRGFSRSTLQGPQDDTHRLATDADDVRRLIGRLADQPALIFGSSSGAIVALEVLSRFPEQVQVVVAHEPPAVQLLPDAATWWAFFDGVYETSRKDGIPTAMHQFAAGVLGSVDQQVLERAMREHANEYTLPNARYWMEHELRQYPRVELDLARLAVYAERIILAGGQDSNAQMTYQPNTVLAQQFGCDIIDFPGGHLGFLAFPAEFTQVLMNALTNELI
jgi:pimeloyl-ACP methyl ester carboxylesterase